MMDYVKMIPRLISLCFLALWSLVACAPGTKQWDDGSAVVNGAHFDGCVRDKTVMVRRDCIGAEALPHELAHLDGKQNPSEDYAW